MQQVCAHIIIVNTACHIESALSGEPVMQVIGFHFAAKDSILSREHLILPTVPLLDYLIMYCILKNIQSLSSPVPYTPTLQAHTHSAPGRLIHNSWE